MAAITTLQEWHLLVGVCPLFECKIPWTPHIKQHLDEIVVEEAASSLATSLGVLKAIVVVPGEEPLDDGKSYEFLTKIRSLLSTLEGLLLQDVTSQEVENQVSPWSTFFGCVTLMSGFTFSMSLPPSLSFFRPLYQHDFARLAISPIPRRSLLPIPNWLHSIDESKLAETTLSQSLSFANLSGLSRRPKSLSQTLGRLNTLSTWSSVYCLSTGISRFRPRHERPGQFRRRHGRVAKSVALSKIIQIGYSNHWSIT